MKRFVSTVLSQDIQNFIDSVCLSLKSQNGSGRDYKEAAKMIAKKFAPSSSNKSMLSKLEKSIIDYMLEQNYVTKMKLNEGYIDNNGIEIDDPDAELPKELASRRYGCRIKFGNNTVDNGEAKELLLDQEFIEVRAYKLREQGVLYPEKVTFYAHPDKDCSAWARDVVEDFEDCRAGRTLNINWTQYYDITITTETATNKTVKYHKLSK